MERNVPKLRFKEFSDEWNKKELKELVIVKGGYAFKSKEFSNSKKKYQIVKMGNVYQNKLLLDRAPSYKENITEKEKEYLLEKGDVIISLTGTVGKHDFGYSYMINEEKNLLLNQRLGLVRAKKSVADSTFIRNILLNKQFLDQFFESSVGGTGNQANVSTKNIEEFKIKVPSLQEQERIANFLTKVDKIIEKQEEKVKNLENYKKGMMQKIFSQEIRFKDENGNEYPEWEIKRVEDIANIQVGFTPDTKNDSFWEGDIKWLSIAGMNSKYIFDGNKRISNEALGKRELIPKNTLVMSFKLTIGRLAIIKEPMITNEAICQFYWKDKNIINEYMYQYLDSIRIESFGCRAAKGITLNNESLNSIIVKLPCIDEQNKIADLLTNIDCINQEELNKLNELKRWKKGLLQQMFV